MQLVFCKAQAGPPPAPGPGEVHVRGPSGQRALASLVLEQGAEALPCGPGAPQLLVVCADPTLDDLLAATFAEQLLAGRELPPGAVELARYAALVREGLALGDGPPEQSLEGLFLAMRNGFGADLSDAVVGARFAERWSRLARLLLQAGEGPLDGAPFAADTELARERAFLKDDRKLFQQDVERGEEWMVRLPDGPPRAAGLLLRAPKSLLFKHWARRAPYLFLAVDRGGGQWVFSTDPVQRLSLRPLAEALQQGERDRDATRASADPWFDGAPFCHTLVAAPHGGTALAEKEVLRIVRRWAHARPARRLARRGLLLAGVAFGALLALVLGAKFLSPGPVPAAGPAVSALVDGQPLPRGSVLDDHQEGWWSTQLDVELAPRRATEVVFLAKHVYARDQLARVWVTVTPRGGELGKLALEVNGRAVEVKARGDERESGEVDVVFRAEENPIRIAVKHDRDGPQFATVRANWRPHVAPAGGGSLYVLCVGVSKYKHLPSEKQLQFAADDARALMEALKRHGRGAFKEVCAYGPLLNEEATHENILTAIQALGENRRADDLIVVTFAGHGEIDRNDDFLFCPYNYDAKKQLATGVYWGLFQGSLRQACPAWLVMDTCHAGAITRPMTAARALAPGAGKLVMTAACLSRQSALEHARWGHGALTLALLEALEGKQREVPGKSPNTEHLLARLAGKDGSLHLRDLAYYAERRVEELTGDGKQTALTNHVGDFAWGKVRVGKRR